MSLPKQFLGQVDIQRGLVAYYPFNGNAQDESENDNHGINHGANLTTDRFGNPNAAYTFNGIDQFISVADHPTLRASTGIAISLWISPTGVGSGSGSNDGGNIINKEGEYEIARLGNEEIVWSLANANPGWWSWKRSNYFADLNSWVHVVLTYDSEIERTTIYIDGEEARTINASGLLGDRIGAQNELWIGGRSGLNQFFDGKIDDVGIYNRGLDRHEVKLLYKSGRQETPCPDEGDGAEFLLGRWEGTFNQYACNINASYPMVAIIEQTDGLVFEGRLEWPSLGAASTMDGYIDGDKVFFFERLLIGGNNIVLNGIYESTLVDCCTLQGFWSVDELQANCQDPQTLIDGGNYAIGKTEPSCPTLCEVFATIEAVICEGEQYENYISTGIYTDTLSNVNGCDSIRTLVLEVLPNIETRDTTTLNLGDSLMWQGILIDQDTTICQSFTGVSACDSVVCQTVILQDEIASCLSNKQANIWYFGHYSGLDFNTSPPTVLTDGQANTFEGVATISDENGRLLFYTDGRNVWNKNHTLMPNGTGLMGNPSATQSGVIIPVPEQELLYYIFTVDAAENNHANGMRYSIVDLGLQSGLGDVIQKNTILMSNSAEKIGATRHANQRDIWVIGRERGNNTFKAHLLTSLGISPNVVESQVGEMNQGYHPGYLKPSADGSRIANASCTDDLFQVMDFNTATGEITNLIALLSSTFDCAYGVEFSPDGKFLYGTSVHVPAKVLQFDLSSNNPQAILASATILANSNQLYKYGAVQLGPDGRIYITSANQWPTPAIYSHLSVIENPNSFGSSADFQEDIIDVSPGRTRLGLPTFMQSYFEPPTLAITGDSLLCLGSPTTYSITTPSVDGEVVEWSVLGNGISIEQQDVRSLSLQSSVSGPIKLMVRYSNFCTAELLDTIDLHVLPELESFSMVSICEGEVYEFAGRPYTVSGNYIDTLQSSGGCDSIAELILEVLPEVREFRDTVICEGETLNWNGMMLQTAGNYVQHLTTQEGCDSVIELELAVYSIQQDTLYRQICFGESFDWLGESYEETGAYTKLDLNGQNCMDELTLVLTVNPTYVEIKDTFICEGEALQFQGQALSVSGLYLDTLVSVYGCDSIIGWNLSMLDRPQFEIIGDSIICLGETTVLSASQSFLSYSWSNESTIESISIAEPGLYMLTVTDESGCQNTDSIFVQASSIGEIYFEVQAPTCPDDENGFIEVITLETSEEHTYRLNNGAASNNSLFENLPAGNYNIEINNQTGCVVDTNLFLATSIHDIQLSLRASSQKLIIGDSTYLEIVTNLENPMIQWSPTEHLSCDSCLITTAYPPISTIYQANLTYEGCTIQEFLEIVVTQKDLFYAPNVFSPNKDGNNDYFTLFPSNAVREIADFRVFDRWGGLVFESSLLDAPNQGWDGTKNGRPLPSGVFVYTFRLVLVDGREETFSGDLLLLGSKSK